MRALRAASRRCCLTRTSRASRPLSAIRFERISLISLRCGPRQANSVSPSIATLACIPTIVAPRFRAPNRVGACFRVCGRRCGGATFELPQLLMSNIGVQQLEACHGASVAQPPPILSPYPARPCLPSLPRCNARAPTHTHVSRKGSPSHMCSRWAFARLPTHTHSACAICERPGGLAQSFGRPRRMLQCCAARLAEKTAASHATWSFRYLESGTHPSGVCPDGSAL